MDDPNIVKKIQGGNEQTDLYATILDKIKDLEEREIKKADEAIKSIESVINTAVANSEKIKEEIEKEKDKAKLRR